MKSWHINIAFESFHLLNAADMQESKLWRCIGLKITQHSLNQVSTRAVFNKLRASSSSKVRIPVLWSIKNLVLFWYQEGTFETIDSLKLQFRRKILKARTTNIVYGVMSVGYHLGRAGVASFGFVSFAKIQMKNNAKLYPITKLKLKHKLSNKLGTLYLYSHVIYRENDEIAFLINDYSKYTMNNQP